MNSIACDERGTLYGITSDGKFYAIDETGKATLISETMLSSSLNYESDLTYDPDTARCIGARFPAQNSATTS
ncbi:MAG: hypothetical protein ACLTXL_00070 [Clostridia bacterium]